MHNLLIVLAELTHFVLQANQPLKHRDTASAKEQDTDE